MDVQYQDAGNHTLFIYLPASSPPNPTTHKGWPHHRGVRPLLFLNYSDVGYFMSHMNKSVKVL